MTRGLRQVAGAVGLAAATMAAPAMADEARTVDGADAATGGSVRDAGVDASKGAGPPPASADAPADDRRLWAYPDGVLVTRSEARSPAGQHAPTQGALDRMTEELEA